MTKSNRALVKRFHNAKTFFEQLKLALEYQAQPAILRDYSPLAKPYFLNQAQPRHNAPTRQERTLVVDWGVVLSQQLLAAAAALWRDPLPPTSNALLAAVEEEMATHGRGPRYDFLILELNYFKRLFVPPPKTQAAIYNDILHISRTSHDRWLKEAVEHLGTVLLQQLRPPLRLETPVHHSLLLGRERTQALALETLKRGGSVALTGPSGIGKSTLGAAIVETWPQPEVFWFTLRRGLNDHLHSLLFALGYFFHQQGASALWLQLIADEGKLEDMNLALGLVRSDIATLPTIPLLCFDEIDLLRAVDVDRPNPHHMQILSFLDSLRPHLALLFMGQRAMLESDLVLTLDRLTRPDLEMWLQWLQVPYRTEELTQLEAYTGGNPRLLTLCLTLHQLERTAFRKERATADPLASEEQAVSLAATLRQLPTTPALVPIWDRLRTRLSVPEHQLLQALAVFRTPAPRDAWLAAEALPPEDGVGEPADDVGEPRDGVVGASVSEGPFAAALAQLQERHLVDSDEHGGLWVLPMLRETLYQEISLEERERFHIAAAHICAARGEYTEAAYHFCQGDQPAQAIATWFPERRTEIQRGQAAAALAIVEQISGNRLQRSQQKQLALLRGELYGLLGEPAKVVATLAAQEWSRDEPESVEAFRLWGEALNVQGDANGAQGKLQAGVEVVAYLLEQHAHLHVQRGLIHMQQREMRAAWQEATRARYYAENLQGAVQANLGNYAAARGHYEVALTLAGELDDSQAAARTEYYLGIAAMQQQDVERAFAHYRAAIAHYQQTGNRVQEVYARSNLAAAYLTAGDYDAAIAEAQQALAFCERMNAPYWMAMNAANLAEAHFELGALEPAERYALQVIEHEEVDSYPYALFTLGSIRRAQTRYDDAVQLYRQSCQIAERNEDRFLLAYIQRALGGMYADCDEMEAAAEQYQRAIALFQQLGIAAEVEATAALAQALQ
ncbi:MAG TPA: tetratricopeptide repeat protein [Caldilineaceae bacterium]|nr:tetratricopeptide repeat protein [Caldilineaceae bacterium]